MLRLVFYVIPDPDNVPIKDGPYDSIQITGDLIRDEDGRTIANRTPVGDGWVRAADSQVYTDIVVEWEYP